MGGSISVWPQTVVVAQLEIKKSDGAQATGADTASPAKKGVVATFDAIPWDNGREFGEGGHAWYFNGLTRSVKGGKLHVGSPSSGMQWSQTFGFDAASGSNGPQVEVTGKKTIVVRLSGSMEGDFFGLELYTDKGTEELWFAHPAHSDFTPVEGGVAFEANLPAGITLINKFQFKGNLSKLNIDIDSIETR